MENNFFKRKFDFRDYEEDILETEHLNIPLGVNEDGALESLNLHNIFHIAIAGSTGSGKTVFLYSTLYTLMKKNTPDELKFVLVDTKQVDLYFMRDSKYLYRPLVNSGDEFAKCLKELLNEVFRRYDLFEKANVSNLDAYNLLEGVKKEPRIVVLVDEFADACFQNNEFSNDFVRLLQISKAAGVTVIFATQIPAKEYYTEEIHANSPTKILLASSNKVSEMFINSPIGETLNFEGDMIFVEDIHTNPVQHHLKGLYISSKDIKNIA